MEPVLSSPPIASLTFEKFQVHNIQLEQREVLTGEGLRYQVDFHPSGRLSWGQGRFELRLKVIVSSAPSSVSVNIDARSYFSFDVAHATEELHKLFRHNTLGLTFPYVRAYLSALTALSGLATVTMPTYNLTAYAKTLAENIEEVEIL